MRGLFQAFSRDKQDITSSPKKQADAQGHIHISKIKVSYENYFVFT